MVDFDTPTCDSDRPRIIARCYADEPVLMVVRGIKPVGNKRGDTYYVVSRPESQATIGWNPGDAYEYTPALYEALRGAHFVFDARALQALWQRATHWRPSRSTRSRLSWPRTPYPQEEVSNG